MLKQQTNNTKDKTFYAGIHPKYNKEITRFNLDILKARVINGKASLIVIDGSGLGEGKTTFAVHIADYIQGAPIDLNVQLAMGGKDFQAKLNLCEEQKKHVIIYDEAGDFNKISSMSRASRNLHRSFDTFRAFKIIPILVLPTALVLDSHIFQNRVLRLLFHVYGRKKSFGRYKAYDIDRVVLMRKLSNKNKEKDDFSRYYRLVQPNFYGLCYDLPKARSVELDKLGRKAKKEINVQATANISGLSTVEQIAAEMGKSKGTVYNATSALKLKGLTIRRKKYFTEIEAARIKAYYEKRAR